MEYDKEYDASGMTCPMPVMQARKTIKRMEKGQVLLLIATDAATKDDVPALADALNCTLEGTDHDDSKYRYYIKVG